MFVSDSLRPPGLENLNGPGPLWEHYEDQAALSASQANATHPSVVESFNPSMPAADHAWSPGAEHRTPEQLVAEYYGGETPIHNAVGDVQTPHALEIGVQKANGQVFTGYDVSAAAHGDDQRPATGASVCGWDSFYADRSKPRGLAKLMHEALGTDGTRAALAAHTNKAALRFQRRDRIPEWQQTGRRNELLTGRWQSAEPGADSGDVEETLGSGSAEFGGERENLVRGYDMRRLTHPRGESYTKYGYTAQDI